MIPSFGSKLLTFRLKNCGDKLTTNGLEEYTAGSTEVEGSSSGIDVAALAQVRQILDLVAVKVSGQVQLFASDDANFATLQQIQTFSPRFDLCGRV